MVHPQSDTVQKKKKDLILTLSFLTVIQNSLFCLIPDANIIVERPFILLGSHINNK